MFDGYSCYCKHFNKTCNNILTTKMLYNNILLVYYHFLLRGCPSKFGYFFNIPHGSHSGYNVFQSLRCTSN